MVAALDVEKDIKHNTRTALAALEAALSEEGVKRFVFTSSSWAAAWPSLHDPVTITAESWNEVAVQKAYEPNAEGVTIFSATKVHAEKAVWDLVKTTSRQADLTLNTMLPAVVFGPVLASEH